MLRTPILVAIIATIMLAAHSTRADHHESPKPLHALLLTGGCCHDYENQKRIISEGISARANVTWTIVHEGGSGTDHKFSMIKDEHWADDYDIVVHNECFAMTKDMDYIKLITDVHKAGKPAIVIHCAMHTFRDIKEDDWREVLGVESRNHGKHEPIAITVDKPDHPIFKGQWNKWTTPQGELYRIIRVMPGTTPLATGKAFGEEHTCVWVNEAGKGRTFGTTIGHHNETMQSKQWLDMTARGLLWACGKLNEDGSIATGYGPQKDWTHQMTEKLPDSENPVELFDGNSLDGWDGDQKIWSVEDGVIVGRNSGKVESSTYLFTEKPYRNFRLLFEVKQTRSDKHSPMHSAVAALGERMDDKGGNTHGFKGPLLMFCNDWGIYDAYGRNRVEPKDHHGFWNPKGIEKVGDWNTIEILVTGNRIRFAANGKLVFDFTDEEGMLKASPLGLQVHSNAQPQEFFFKGLVITENPEDTLVTVEE